jgi:phosphoribosylformimino-5-aminoimidazole carboxamide ribotide isomerase
MLIIPAIDILDGKLVRLQKGDFNRVSDYGISPVDQARKYFEYGFEWLHMVDLTGSKDGNINTAEIITGIRQNTGLKIEFGGGIRSAEDASRLIGLGVDRLVIGSLALTNKNEFFKILASVDVEKICIAADVKGERVMIRGWKDDSQINLYDHIHYCYCKGINTFLVTDIERDGMLLGPNYDLYDSIMEKYPSLNVIVSGGIANIDDVVKLKEKKFYGVVIGKAIYENKLSLEELKGIAD